MLDMKRIHRKRIRGWRMPEDAVYVGRPTKWGNPYKVGDLITPQIAVDLYRDLLDQQIGSGKLNLNELRGKDLACFCRDGEPCHADVLIEFCEKMALNLSIIECYCHVKVFNINGVEADTDDFGEQYDADPEGAIEGGCGDMTFHAKPPTSEILKKYRISESQYEEIAVKLTNLLSFGSCGWCV